MTDLPNKKAATTEWLETDRILGLFALIGGAAAIYYFIIRQAIAATRHDPGVFLSPKCVMGSPVVFAIGVVYTVFGSRMTDALGDNTKRPARTGWILIVVFCIADQLLYWRLKSFIEGYGYAISY